MKKSDMQVVGRNAKVTIVGYASDVPAKVDTGADSSAVWATNIRVDEAHHLRFVLFGEGSLWYTGEEIVTDDYSVSQVRSSSGHVQIRFRVILVVRIKNKTIQVRFTLADRRRNHFPMLIGRRTLANRFVVDVAQAEYEGGVKSGSTPLNDELSVNPHAFYKKYHQNNHDSDKVRK